MMALLGSITVPDEPARSVYATTLELPRAPNWPTHLGGTFGPNYRLAFMGNGGAIMYAYTDPPRAGEDRDIMIARPSDETATFLRSAGDPNGYWNTLALALGMPVSDLFQASP